MEKQEMKEKYIRPWTDLYSEQMAVRLEKRNKMVEKKSNPYKNGIAPSNTIDKLIKKYGDIAKEDIGDNETASIAGRALLVRKFGKANFIQIDDGTGKFQVYAQKGQMSDEDFDEFKLLDYGDIFYADGTIFRTNKGELTLLAKKFTILTKSIRPLPEKFHGLTDPELCYRMRYLDMIMNPEVRDVLRTRSNIVRGIREFFYSRDYLEVETPMLHSVAGGATARPFTTHHNALDMDLFLRIAPELHLKRLIVGGYPRVFEMNRCFRNEGISQRHNPEFTMVEFYQAYATYEDLIELTEELVAKLAVDVVGSETVKYGDEEISFAKPFCRMTMREAVAEYSDLSIEDLSIAQNMMDALLNKSAELDKDDLQKMSEGKLLELCFEEFAESHLIQPTFITEYPTVISPLSRRNDENPDYVDRFEFFINGWEVGNAFSELNNPTDQLERFAEQGVAKDMGDNEACDVDYDYVRALEFGMPPTAGEGLGIDRLTMIFTNSKSIRDVILFPQLKKEVFFSQTSEENR